MICKCYGGPEDGGTEIVADNIQPGQVHGIAAKHYVSDHPFVAASAQDPLIACPAVVVFYKYSFDPLKKAGELHFVGYKK